MLVGTLANHDDRAQIIQRLGRLEPGTRPAWGTLDAPRMLCHVADQMRVALGDLPCRPTHNLATRTLLKFLVVDTAFQPLRGKIRTAPEMLTTRPSSWEADLSACMELAERMARGSPHAVHPTFGPLSPRDWGRLSWKHLDHHLVQFGA